MDQSATSPDTVDGRGIVHSARPLLLASSLILASILAFLIGSMIRSGVNSRADLPTGQPVAATTGERIETLQRRLAAYPDDSRSAVMLAEAYLQQARETADPSYYAKAESLLWQVLEREPDKADAMAWMGAVQLSKHEFQSALEWGLRAHAADPDLLPAYPVLIDAYIELGQYPQAIAMADEFVLLRPDVRSYSRVAYLRELFGDRDGAIQAMQLALGATPFMTETAAWTQVQLGNLYFNGGDLEAAKREYDRTLSVMPDYAPALSSLGRIAAAHGDYDAAIDFLTRASTTMPIPEYVIALGDVYTLVGDITRAEEQYELVRVIDRFLAANGVNTDLELALFEADHPGQVTTSEQVVTSAREARNQRPNIYGHDVLAWALYRVGSYEEAQREIEQALKRGTQDALLYFHAGMIAKARGDLATARARLASALEINPYFSILYSAQANAEFEALRAGGR